MNLGASKGWTRELVRKPVKLNEKGMYGVISAARVDRSGAFIAQIKRRYAPPLRVYVGSRRYSIMVRNADSADDLSRELSSVVRRSIVRPTDEPEVRVRKKTTKAAYHDKVKPFTAGRFYRPPEPVTASRPPGPPTGPTPPDKNKLPPNDSPPSEPDPGRKDSTKAK